MEEWQCVKKKVKSKKKKEKKEEKEEQKEKDINIISSGELHWGRASFNQLGVEHVRARSDEHFVIGPVHKVV